MSDPDTLRRLARASRRRLSDAERKRASGRIAREFLNSHLFYASHVIGCYLPTYDEVDTRAVFNRAWRTSKRIAVPVVQSDESMAFVSVHRESRLVRNRFGIWEPTEGERIAPRAMDVCVVPGVAFDARGNRVGMGGGYYDRTFAFLNRTRNWARPKLVGFAFACQCVDQIDTRPWDVALHRVITERD